MLEQPRLELVALADPSLLPTEEHLYQTQNGQGDSYRDDDAQYLEPRSARGRDWRLNTCLGAGGDWTGVGITHGQAMLRASTLRQRVGRVARSLRASAAAGSLRPPAKAFSNELRALALSLSSRCVAPK